MLGKLLKYEFRAVSKTMLLINSITLILTVIGCLTFVSPIWEIDSPYTGFLAISSAAVYYIALVSVSIAAVVYLIVRYYRNLYTDEGYLMHTLPVSPWELLLSKLTASACWTFITSFCAILSMAAIFISAVLKFGLDEFYDLSEVLIDLNSALMEVYGLNLSGLSLYGVAAVLIGGVSGLLMAYAAIAIGQFWHKHKVLGSVLCYGGFSLLNRILVALLQIPYYFSLLRLDLDTLSSHMRYQMNSTLLLSLFSAVVYYVIAEQLMRRKLNLD